jgi:hypothetical protein
VHVTWKVVHGLPALQKRRFAMVIGETMREAARRHEQTGVSFGVVHFSIQNDHLHLVVEAGSKQTMGRELRRLGITIAIRLNKQMSRSGRVIVDRYHARPVSTPRETRNLIVYVLQNHKHHERSAFIVDENSSGPWWNGWERHLTPPATAPPVRAPRTWLAAVGWRAGGPVRFSEGPAA